MHNQLKQIYEDVRAEKITRMEALERIRTLKGGGGGEAALLVPRWQALAPAVEQHGLYAEHVLVLCGTAAVNTGELTTLIPADRCLVWPLQGESDLAQSYTERARACFSLVQEMLGRGKSGARMLQVVVADTPELGVLAGLAGLLKTAAQENPQFAGQLIFVDPHTCTPALARLLAAEAAQPHETLVRHRHGRREVLRWQLATAPAAPAPVAFKEGGIYLITGGMGALGRLFAAEILRQTRHAKVVLTGRAALTEQGQAALGELGGARVSYRRLDLASLPAVTQALAEVVAEHGQLNGIVHAAGQIADDFIVKKELAQFDAVLAPKVAGTLHLALASEALALDFLALFSSIAGALGNAAQADYAAANGFMDHFAAYANARLSAQGRPGRTLSINWSLWHEGGMRLDQQSVEHIAQRTGLQPLHSAAALQAFHDSLAAPSSQCLVTGGATDGLRRWLAAQDSAYAAPADAPPRPPVDAPAAGADQAERYLCKVLAGVLKLAPHKIDVRAPLEQYGIDSILAMKLTAELETVFGPLSKTLFFEYQTIADLAAHFVVAHADKLAVLLHQGSAAPIPPVPQAPVKSARARRIGAPGAVAAPAPLPPAPQAARANEPIAIVGLSGRYPEAPDLDTFWDNLRQGRDCVTEVPASRWNWRDYYSEDRTEPGRHYSRWGGFIHGVDEFDAAFFNIAPREAKLIDPQERLFLQHAWMALEDAGYTRAALEAGGEEDEVGVYAGVMYSEYQMFGVEASMRGQRTGINGSIASIANRVSYFLNLHGPSMTLDTMCSSSLTAIHLACQDLRSGRISAALAGGVNVSVHANKYLLLSSSQFISSAGQCQSFGEGGSGYIPGEGVGVVLLKRLSDAVRDGDHIYATIRGSALSHGGKTNGISVPNPRGQANAIRRALDNAGVAPGQVSYVEAHGTGTKLGDPIEIAALHAVFQPHMPVAGTCRIGSVKSNIGHCESAAGVAALTKVLLQMKHRQIVPSLHSARLNPHIDFDSSPFVVNQGLCDWALPADSATRIAGISSFGAGGSNAHLVVEEYIDASVAAAGVAPGTVQAILLSARTADQLLDKARALLAFVRRAPLDAASLQGIAFTLQAGREAMEERLSVTVASAAELAAKLQSFVDGDTQIDGLSRSQAKRHREALAMFGSDGDLRQLVRGWLAERKLDVLVDLWGKGLEVDWRAMYGDQAPRRVSLPAYPFARERHWIDAGQGSPVAAQGVLHPLVQHNISTLSQHAYSASFHGGEDFLVERVLPEAACLEMVRAALEMAQPPTAGATLLELRDIAWGEPFVAAAGRELHLALTPGAGGTAFDIFSSAGGVELVHCQGMAPAPAAAAARRLDLAALQAGMTPLADIRALGEPDVVAISAGPAQWLVQLSAPAGAEAALSLRALAAVVRLGVLLAFDAACVPVALAAARFAKPCPQTCLAWIRLADGSLDVDLVDAQGQLILELRGLAAGGAGATQASETTVSITPTEKAPAVDREHEMMFATAGELPAPGKPTRVGLSAPADSASRPATLPARVPVVLLDPTLAAPAAPVPPVRLFALGGGVFSVRVSNVGAANAVIKQLVAALDAVALLPEAKVIQLHGEAQGFLPQIADADPVLARRLYAALAAAPVPVIAVMPSGATGAAFVAGAMCDFMVCAEESDYGYCGAAPAAFDACELSLLYERFGAVLADDLLTRRSGATAAALREKGLACPIVPSLQVQAHAEQLARSLAAHGHEALHLLKRHLARRLAALLEVPPEAIALPVRDAGEESWPSGIALEWHADGCAVVQLDPAAGSAAHFTAALRAHPKLRALVLVDAGAAWSTDEGALLFSALQDFVARVAVPVVVALEGDARDTSLLIGLLADGCVCNADAMYGVAPDSLDARVAGTAGALLTQRFGDAAGKLLLMTGTQQSGAELQRQAGRIVAAEAGKASATAVTMACSLAALGPAALVRWRAAAANACRVTTRSMEAWTADAAVASADDAASCVVLASGVVSALAYPNGIWLVRMEDRRARNMFSDELVAGMNEVFANIAASKECKVVILTGYDRYFASGGTKENLLAIQAGSAQFTDSRLFELALRCPVPVISAMQGHGIGAGWSLGMFADFPLFSERGEYSSPYMAYGFTPGAGATLVFPERIGYDLARETMLTGQQYSGAALRQRGLLLPVLGQGDIDAAAMALAGRIARLPRALLLALKAQLAERLRASIDEACGLELAMHAQTFVGRADTLQRIEQRFAAAPAAAATPGVSMSVPAEAIEERLRTLLAQELQMQPGDIDRDTQFVDLGMDSVSGVTWVRKINEQLGIAIEATQIYSYPTLTQFAGHIRQLAGVQPAAAAVAVPAQSDAGVLDTLRTLLAQELQMEAAAIDDTAQFVDLGLDSVSGVTWMRKINALYGTAIEATQIYSYPSLAQLGEHVRQAARLQPGPVVVLPPVRSAGAPRLVRTVRAAGSRAPLREAIAVVGMAGQFPMAGDVDGFWRNLAEGRDCISEVASSRWDSNAYYQAGEPAPGKTNSRWLGALQDYDCFDPLFFNISPSEAESMDPQQRLFLQASWHAIEHAGYDAADLSGSKCGVFVGCAGTSYHQHSAERLSSQGFTGAASSILAARISYFLNLQGPSLAIDTACSSSLVAIAQACDSLIAGTIDSALAGGVYVMTGPDLHIQTAQAGMLSVDGRCFTFDQRANGFVPGEAVGTVMLKRLSDAQRDGDTIHAVVRGWGVNQDGKTNGITAPNPQAQAALQRDVHARFSIDPASIGLIEAHGTGTKLGDPIEVQALKQSFGQAGHCALGSVKSNIGHCLTAAGVTGFVKLVQALKHRQLPPTIHFKQLNEHIDLRGSPFYVNDRLQPWDAPGGAPRRAAISSFGFSGTNAHLVLEEYRQEQLSKAPAGTVIVPLSAKTPEQLRQRVADLCTALSEQPAFTLAELACTLQLGRAAMEQRLVFMAASLGELALKLAGWLNGEKTQDDSAGSPLAAAWLAGGSAAWQTLYAGARPRRVALPLYPFARERYWITAPAPAPVPAPANECAALLVPHWQAVAPALEQHGRYAEHVLVLCGTDEVNTGELTTLIPADRCLAWPLAPDCDLARSYAQRARACFALVQEMLGQGTNGMRLLQVVVADTPDLNLLAGLAGLLKTAAQENPQFAGQLILVDAQTSTPALARLLGAEAAEPHETLVRHRAGRREVLRWQPAPAAPAPVAFKEGGTYLITGGMGALGRLFAAEIMRQTERATVILTGRAALTAQGQATLTELGGKRVSYRQLDLGSLAAVTQLLADVVAAHGQLNGIVHAAGQIADQFIVKKTAAQFDAVLDPKVLGTLNLAQASEALPLDFLVLFSSVAGALGNAGQADYAAANGFMDQFAAYSKSRHGRTLSVNWSLWQDGGMQLDQHSMAQITRLTGMRALPTRAALDAFYAALALDAPQCLAVAGDVGQMLRYLDQAPVSMARPAAQDGTASERVLSEQTLHKMKQLFGAVIKLPPARIEASKELSAYGIDSLMVTKLNGEFAKVFGPVAKTLVFEYTTLAALSGYFVQHHRDRCLAWIGAQEPPQPALPPPLPRSAAPAAMPRVPGAEEPIAIVGVSGIFPQAQSLAEFWDNLKSGKDSVTEIPSVRWSQQSFYDADMMRAVEQGKSYSKWGGFVAQFDQFDPLFFGIAPSEAMNMDPQERMFLQAAWHCMESAAYTRADLREKFQRKVGVFAGITKQGYNLHGTQSARRERKFHPHTSFGSLANRLSYLLDITGPSMPIDTMCSSSLTAIHQACEQIRRGECALAFAGAVNLYTHPSNYVDMASQYALSPDGRCRSFGAGANGFVPGEGVGVLLLRPLADALADGDVIHGLILGTHVNHGGKTNGYTVPSPRAQAELIARTIRKAGIDARDISYVEAHGTGTALGDPIEIEGLRQAFAVDTSEKGYCRIGSVKSNIGHCEAAAGMAGMAKILLQMKHRQLAPSLHADQLNSAIDFASTPFVVNTALAPWAPLAADGAPQARIAAISGFGAGGANAHVIVKEFDPAQYPQYRQVRPAPGRVIVPLSARTATQLREVAVNLLAFLEGEGALSCLAALACTLQGGREAMEQRVSFVADSTAMLADQLRAYLTGGADVQGCFTGQVDAAGGDVADMLEDDAMHAAVASWLGSGKLASLARWWSRGLVFDWNALYPQGKPNRMTLPGYPFASDRYWNSPLEDGEPVRAPEADGQLSRTIDEIVNRIDTDDIDSGQACELLNAALREG